MNVDQLPTSVQWSPRVPREKIRRLYETSALGLLDEELIDDVGYSFHARCQDILEVGEAMRGRVACRQCGETILRTPADTTLACGGCGWQMPWAVYQKRCQHKQLASGGAASAFRAFVAHWPGARSLRHKLLLIDRLIHEFHVNFGRDTRPVVANVIRGKTQELMAFLDELAYGPGSPAEATAWQRV